MEGASDCGSMVVVALAELLVAFGSVSLAVALAVFVICPVVVGVTRMVVATLSFKARVPRVQLIGPVPLQVPLSGVAEMKVTLAGSVSVN
jgi:hypothetical protein